MGLISRPTSNRRGISALILRGFAAAGVVTLLTTGIAAISSAQTPDADMAALIETVTQAREACYAEPECPNIDELMGLFTANPRRTEIQRDSSVVVQLEGAEALRADHLRVAQRFTGRRLETVQTQAHGRNLTAFQLNWDPGADAPNPFVSVFRIEDGKVAHWVLVAP